MTEQKPNIISIGEVMIELTRGPDSRYGLSFGGDTFNTAVYLARAGIDVAYATALGDDPYSDALLSLASAEGVRTELIVRAPNRTSGLYLVETNAKGERSNGPRIGRHRLISAKRCFSNSSASSPIRSRTRCGADFVV